MIFSFGLFRNISSIYYLSVAIPIILFSGEKMATLRKGKKHKDPNLGQALLGHTRIRLSMNLIGILAVNGFDTLETLPNIDVDDLSKRYGLGHEDVCKLIYVRLILKTKGFNNVQVC